MSRSASGTSGDLPPPPGAVRPTSPWWAAPLEAWQDWRNRRIASHRFRRWAAGFWPTRPLARRQAAQLFDIVAGFVYSQVLLACVRLDLFERLAASGPQRLDELAPVLALPARAAERLLDAAVALRLLGRRRGGRYA
ncbi:MAG: hypothetical protein KF683_23820, partial [Rubrivivax sp.]|nr:hypothetical protein [Rubrivivax sp.]